MKNNEWDKKWGYLWGEDKTKYVLRKNSIDSGFIMPYHIYTEHGEFMILEIFDKKEVDYVLSKMIENGTKVVDSFNGMEFKVRKIHTSKEEVLADEKIITEMFLKGYSDFEILKSMNVPDEFLLAIIKKELRNRSTPPYNFITN